VCGRFNLIDNPEVKWLCKALGIELYDEHASRDFAPGGDIAIVHERAGARVVSTATWWLFLDNETLKPNYKYASFNSRSDKLFSKRALAYRPFRESRCLIPASAFVEGLGDKKTYHKIELEGSAIAFGGLFKEYLDKESGEVIYSASIITLPPLSPQWLEIHPKSLPLMIDFEDEDLVSRWLDHSNQDVEQFEALLESTVLKPMKVTKIDKPSCWNPIEESFMIIK
jgi:putative SOS response-associated peptidase YedK